MTLHVRALTEEERTKLERIIHAQTAPVRLVRRAHIIQLAGAGLTVPAIAAHVQQSEKCVRLWIERFNAAGLDGLDDAPRSGRPRTYQEDASSRVIAKARSLPPKPADGEVPPTCHWTLDRLQQELAKDGVPIKRSQIRRLLKAEHLTWQKPRTKPRTWLESDDPSFAEKKGTIVRLYTDPPPGSTVICLDEFGPVAAKRYSGPSWSQDAHRPHFRPSYARHGYRWAFGALRHRTGAVFLETAATRDTVAWLHFLEGLEGFVPEGEAYLIVDALPLHWTLETMLWNWGHPRFHFVPLPKAAAWLNLIEGFWKILDQRALAGRDCTSPEDVDAALHAGVDDWSQRPTPFLWGRPPTPQRHLKRTYVYRI